MINEEKLKEIQSGSAFVPLRLESQLDGMEVEDLLHLRGQIDARLPVKTLKDMSLEDELVEQYLRVKTLQERVLGDDSVPINQVAQVANSVSSTLAQLTKAQVDLRRDEQLKRMEAALLEAVSTLPDEARGVFFTEYERIADRYGATQ